MKNPTLKHVKFTRAKGKLYAYFNTGRKVNGKTVYASLPEFGTVGFYDSYSSYLGSRKKRSTLPGTVSDLADEWERSEAFGKLAVNTQSAYRLTLKKVRAQFGKLLIDRVERKHVREVVNNRITGNGSRNLFLSTVGALYHYGRDMELTDNEPAKGIKRFKMGQHEPWDVDLLQAALACDIPRVRLAVHLLYYTGQRIGDVAGIRWSDMKGGAIFVTQQKTGKPLRVPLHSALEAELANTPRRGITMLTSETGRRVQQAAIRNELQSWAEARGHKVVPHGLRKNAVNALLMAGCTIAEVASITGQSFAMVEHYARKVDQHHMGEAAILKLEGKRKMIPKTLDG